ncbi:MAG: hypothetical protein Q9211_005583 [Gyalolechia sp. 1 TL-2023]
MDPNTIYVLNVGLAEDTAWKKPIEAVLSDTGEEAQHMVDVDAANEFFEPDAVDEQVGSYPNGKGTTKRITEIAPELRNAVLKWLLETAFYPGLVYPHIHVDYDTYICGEKQSYPAARPDLLLLNHSVLEDHEESFWSENTIVIGPGYPSYSTDFLDKVPASNCIRKIDLRFTIRDLEENLLYCLPPDHFSWEPYHYYESKSSFYDGLVRNNASRTTSGENEYDGQLGEKYDMNTDSATSDVDEDSPNGWPTWGNSPNQIIHQHDFASVISTESSEQHDELMKFELRSIWLDKIYHIRSLPLAELTLDSLSVTVQMGGGWVEKSPLDFQLLRMVSPKR